MDSPLLGARSAVRLFWTDDEKLIPGPQQPERRPVVVDSWLVLDGRTRRLDLHEERFGHSGAKLLGLPDERIRRFLVNVRMALPRKGAWFPRLEAYESGFPHLSLWLRPAPPLAATTSLWVSPDPDPRQQPRVKGPDLPALEALRAEAGAVGCDDALLRAPDGTVLEAAHSSIVWWRDGTLCFPAPDLMVLPSVTCILLANIARRRGVAVEYERCRIDDLDGLEVWSINALHGIRSVTHWAGVSIAVATPNRARSWREALDALLTPTATLSHPPATGPFTSLEGWIAAQTAQYQQERHGGQDGTAL